MCTKLLQENVGCHVLGGRGAILVLSRYVSVSQPSARTWQVSLVSHVHVYKKCYAAMSILPLCVPHQYNIRVHLHMLSPIREAPSTRVASAACRHTFSLMLTLDAA